MKSELKTFPPSTFEQSQIFFAASTGNYANRTNAGQVTQSFNEVVGQHPPFEKSDRGRLGTRCDIADVESDVFENVNERYRFMYTTLEERARALESHLRTLQNEMCTMANIPVSSLQPVGIPSQTSFGFVAAFVVKQWKGKSTSPLSFSRALAMAQEGVE